MLSWVIITFGNWWLAKLILKYTTKWRFILPTIIVTAMGTATVVTAMCIIWARQEAEMYGMVLSAEDDATIILLTATTALFYGLIICLVSTFLNRRKIMKNKYLATQ